MSGIIQKAMGPVMAAVGAASEYFFPGNPYGIAAITQGAGQSLGQGGLFGSLLGGGQNAQPPPNPPPTQTAAAFGAPPTPAIPTSSMTGFNLGAPPVQYAQQQGGAGGGGGAGGSTDLINQAIAQALGGGAGGGGAFSQYQSA